MTRSVPGTATGRVLPSWTGSNLQSLPCFLLLAIFQGQPLSSCSRPSKDTFLYAPVCLTAKGAGSERSCGSLSEAL